MKKIFVISDVHGHYTELVRDLKEAGYDENNTSHLLISLGDMFDRGEESLAVYLYLKRLSDEGKAICLKGNHEPMFTDLLKNSSNSFNFAYNGTDKTIDDFYHQSRSFFMYMYSEENRGAWNFGSFIKKVRREINDEFPELIEWIDNLPYYYETKNHIFTHASIDLSADDWRQPNKSWASVLVWDDGSFICRKNTTNKNIVVGHFDTGHLRHLWAVDSKDKNDHSILKTNDGMIFIDGCVVVSKKINVLVIEDGLNDR